LLWSLPPVCRPRHGASTPPRAPHGQVLASPVHATADAVSRQYVEHLADDSAASASPLVTAPPMRASRQGVAPWRRWTSPPPISTNPGLPPSFPPRPDAVHGAPGRLSLNRTQDLSSPFLSPQKPPDTIPSPPEWRENFAFSLLINREPASASSGKVADAWRRRSFSLPCYLDTPPSPPSNAPVFLLPRTS
jgi:hypothetical protein